MFLASYDPFVSLMNRSEKDACVYLLIAYLRVYGDRSNVPLWDGCGNIWRNRVRGRYTIVEGRSRNYMGCCYGEKRRKIEQKKRGGWNISLKDMTVREEGSWIERERCSAATILLLLHVGAANE